MKGAGIIRSALSLAVIIAALSIVAWRQSVAREVLEARDAVERHLALSADEREELERRLAVVESRSWVVAQAGERLGMRPASDRELILLPGVAR